MPKAFAVSRDVQALRRPAGAAQIGLHHVHRPALEEVAELAQPEVVLA